MNKRFRLIINPASGTVGKMRILPNLQKKMERLGLDYEVVVTKGLGHAKELAIEAAAEGYYGVLACGGDGTVNDVATGIINTNTALGIIPTGSGNGLARHLGIPIDVNSSLDVIAEDNVILSDFGTANGKPFFCTFGVGFDAKVSERCIRERRRGIMMYLKSALREYIKFTPEEYMIEVNGHVISEHAFLVVCCNASQYGNNAFIAPHASVTDGELDITIVHAGNPIKHAIAGLTIMAGLIRKNTFVNVVRASSIRIIRKTDSVAHIDGDALCMPATIDIECHHSQLRVFAPTKETMFRPIITPTILFFKDVGLSVKRIFQLKHF